VNRHTAQLDEHLRQLDAAHLRCPLDRTKRRMTLVDFCGRQRDGRVHVGARDDEVAQHIDELHLERSADQRRASTRTIELRHVARRN
jgi:hypothetical protein